MVSAQSHLSETAHLMALSLSTKLALSRVSQLKTVTLPLVCVCDLVFLSRYMRPEGPWQRWLFLVTRQTSWPTGLTGHSGPLVPKKMKIKEQQSEEKENTHPSDRRNKRQTKGKVQGGPGPPPLRSPPPPPLEVLFRLPCTPPPWCAKHLAPPLVPSPPTGTEPTWSAALSTLRPPRPPSIASSSAVATPGIS